MLYREIPVQMKHSANASLVLYIQDYSADMLVQERPMVILCPGGGYDHISVRESESEALQFLAMGCHAAVLRYTVAERYTVPLTELAFAVKYIREHAEEWHIDRSRVIVQGSSAGGHLAASLGVFWQEKWLWEPAGADSAEEIKPDGMLLCYPVITAEIFAQRGYLGVLTGGDETLLERFSLEKSVNPHTPRAFIWHTFTDATVPVENSLLLVGALRRHNIPTEFHLYPKGQHGLALASPLTASRDGSHMQKECESWIALARVWIENL
ncbi:MAG: alpha/beta hydrolase [Lachnospiraceae bacterium]|nr:alpha/beta hydrolase [Lachnospiraceae bacterium]